ncbi:glycerophosphodiester phosphodiesterase [Alicyclobacillus tolerans]|uniref:glycerophosphodiester phosphodiesterase n=1 Tax=Alicyclobacillus tolerans TaxID=90970 RepID=UPI003B8109E9
MEKRTQIWAHRGYSLKYPENTMLAFEQASIHGADGIELDVHLSGDGVPVIIHDNRLERTTNGRGWVEEKSSHELRQLDAGSWKGAEFSDCRIPTLEEVLDWVVKRVPYMTVNLELKRSRGNPSYDRLAQRVLSLVKQYRMLEKVIFSSFQHPLLCILKEMESQAQTGLLVAEPIHRPWVYMKHWKANAYHPDYRLLDQSTLEILQAQGIRVHVYTVNHREAAQKLTSAGVDAMITDCLEDIRDALEEKN